jgi:hypothetical protein
MLNERAKENASDAKFLKEEDEDNWRFSVSAGQEV